MLPDNRLRYPPTKIDFDNEVGVTGQPHDEIPAAGQARYDWMRMALIAALSNQASFEEPVNYRSGTIWFDLNVMGFKVRVGPGVSGSEWKSLADAVVFDDATLSEWYVTVNGRLLDVHPEITFSGRCAADASSIPIPESVRSAIVPETKAFVWVNGSLVDPRMTQVDPGTCPTKINLVDQIQQNDRFTVSLRVIKNQYFVTGDVIA